MKMKKRQTKDDGRQTILSHAERLLTRITEAEELIASDTKAMLVEIEAVKQKYDRIGYWTRILKDLEKKLTDLMKTNSGAIFEGEERVELKNGSLLFTIEKRVKRVRDMLENLKAQGFKEAIIINESVDWDLIEKWPAERLALVGTKRGRNK